MRSGTCTGSRSCTKPSCRWSVGKPVASKTETYSRGQALGQVLGDDRGLQFALPGDR